MNHLNKAKTVSNFSILVTFPVILFVGILLLTEQCCIILDFHLTVVKAEVAGITYIIIILQFAN